MNTMSVANIVCWIDELTKEQINSLVNIAPDDGFSDFAKGETVIGFSEGGNFGTWRIETFCNVATYQEMMPLLENIMRS
jgi:hypothetical protein